MEITAQTWREFIQAHKDQEEYERNAESIQKIIDPKDQPTTSFAHLMGHPTIVTLTKSSIEDEVQATFFHSKVKLSLLSSEHNHLALSGFGKRVCAMRVDTKEIFKTSSAKKKIPSFEALMNCSHTDDLLALTPKEGWEESKLELHAILSPFLTDIFFGRISQGPRCSDSNDLRDKADEIPIGA